MMKKLALTASALLLTLGLASCGGEPAPKPSEKPSETPTEKPTETPTEIKDVQLLFWGPAAEESVYNWAVETNNADPERRYNITATFAAIGEDKADTEMIKDVAAGADVYFFADDKTINLQKANALSSLVGENEEFVNANMTKAGAKAAVLGGEMVAYPASIDNLWFANYDKSFYTEEDVRSLETILSKAEAAGKTVSLPITTGWYVLPSFWSESELFWTKNQDGTLKFTTNLDDPKAAEQGEYLNKLFMDYKNKGVLTIGQTLGTESNSVYTWNGAWEYDNYVKNIGDNLALTTTPSYKVGEREVRMKSFMGAKLLGVNAAHDADKVAASHDIAHLLLSKEGSLLRYEARQMIPVNAEALEDTRYVDHLTPTVKAIGEQAKVGGFSQAATCQGSIWDVFSTLGNALVGLDGANDAETGLIADWGVFMKDQAERIRGLAI